MKNRTFQIVFTSLISLLVSLLVGLYSLYLSFNHNYWFIYIGSYFVTEGIFILISLFIKEEFKRMKFIGIFQVINVIALMCYLLVMILWNDEGNMIFNYSYYVFGGAALLKFILYLINSVSVRHEYSISLHTYRNNDFISFSYLAIIIELIIFKYFYHTTDAIYIYIVEGATNAIFTILSAFFALSTVVRATAKEEVTTMGKIKTTIKWFNDHEISFFLSTIFSSYLATMAFANIKNSFFFFFLGLYYVFMSFIRFINYIWHSRIKKSCGDNVVKENRLSSFILLFDAFIFSVSTLIISSSAIAVMTNKITVDTNIYLFLFFIIPLLIFRIITNINSSKKYREEKNTYKLGLSLISLIAIFFSVLEIVAIICRLWPVWAQVLVIITAVVVVNIAVTVVCLIFVIHFIRSLIVNRRSKEKVG